LASANKRLAENDKNTFEKSRTYQGQPTAGCLAEMSDDFTFSLLTIGLVAGLFIGFVFGYAVRASMSRRKHRIARKRRG
jgi:hypothetical protein